MDLIDDDDTPADSHALLDTKELEPLVSNHEDSGSVTDSLENEPANDNETDIILPNNKRADHLVLTTTLRAAERLALTGPGSKVSSNT